MWKILMKHKNYTFLSFLFTIFGMIGENVFMYKCVCLRRNTYPCNITCIYRGKNLNHPIKNKKSYFPNMSEVIGILIIFLNAPHHNVSVFLFTVVIFNYIV